MRPDLIVCHPFHVDYPIWRQQIKDNRGKFDKVIVVFTNMNTHGDVRSFVQEAMKLDDVTFADSDSLKPDQDWRDAATNRGLLFSESDWVFFTEQDFFFSNSFWEKLVEKSSKNDCVVYSEGERPHPCCWLVKRSVIDQTDRDFGVIPDIGDHFSKFYKNLVDLEAKIELIPKDDTFDHLNGLSQNMHMLQSGEEPNFRPMEFKKYLHECLYLTNVPLLPAFVELAKKYLEDYS